MDEETGLYYYRARMYDAHLGRFLQTDPISYFDSMNLYQYCTNNPVNWVDPWGLCKTDAEKFANFLKWLRRLLKIIPFPGATKIPKTAVSTVLKAAETAAGTSGKIVDKYSKDIEGAFPFKGGNKQD